MSVVCKDFCVEILPVSARDATEEVCKLMCIIKAALAFQKLVYGIAVLENALTLVKLH